MFKLIVLAVLFTMGYSQLTGGYTNRPDLIHSTLAAQFVKLAKSKIEGENNLYLVNDKVTHVETQVVAGINYKITFTADSLLTSSSVICTAVVYQNFSGAQKLTSTECI
ncbi:unnamed protein product [Didymodactylos carnosus]|uniref:Cystatin domain-containing protein n=1 Tax=Didymodactylos carnosus TaxID=1234261 RepID=A0A813NN97_9BILA|nr:unnamed protein product [Didymodactylos carnosus]CAF0742390.1 unnamed protein product [Didymodactylos carnosus]CAF3519198.1 unnamed protein product [Didymodactylos carnosus]CAF3520873.1 unnamed protein product [Didymodactylos carnosus]